VLVRKEHLAVITATPQTGSGGIGRIGKKVKETGIYPKIIQVAALISVRLAIVSATIATLATHRLFY
jgi:hypothetical protein